MLDTYVMMLVPTKTPQEVIDRLSAATMTVLKKPEVLSKVRTAGLEVTAGGPSELKARIAREFPLWQEVVKVADITPQ